MLSTNWLSSCISNGVSADITAGLVDSGSAKAVTNSVRVGDRKIDVRRVTVTEAGRAALAVI
jgi:hypothetical protein